MHKKDIKKILICDDHELYRYGLKGFVIDYFNENIEIIEAKNGEEAFNYYKKFKPDIVFLDIEMPKEHGLSVCEKIKKLNKEVLILIVSMHTDKIMYSAVKKAQANGYITKGDTNEKIIECLNFILTTGGFFSPLKELFASESDYMEFELIINDIEELTYSEKKVIKLALEGKSSEEIAELLFVSTKSVNNYRNRISRKLHLPQTNNSLNRWLAKNQSALKIFFT